MSSESDSGEFFDAEENTPVKSTRNISKPPDLQANKNVDVDNKDKVQKILHPQDSLELPDATILNAETSLLERREIELKALENEKRRRRLEELRKRVNDDDDNYDLVSEVSSQASSIDSMYVQQMTLLKTVEADDTQSTMSLGKVGQILSGSDVISISSDYSNDVRLCQVAGNLKDPAAMGALQEPDVVASTKGDRQCELLLPPVAPPRRKRKSKNVSAASGSKAGAEAADVPLGPSPSSSMTSLSKDYEHSLDLSSALKGQYVVKPQDDEKDKAEGPPSLAEVFLQETASASTDSLGNADPNVKQLNMIVRTRTDSGKQLTDLEILEQVMVLNLDTGEQIPLSLAEDRLPRCINPLSLHIMRLTSEYVSNSSLDKDKESDEDADDLKKSDRASDQLEAGVKRRTRRIKRLINRTVNKIKSVADELNHGRHNEEAIESSEDEPSGDRHAIKFKNASNHKGPYEFDNLRLIQDLTGEHTGAVWTMKFSYCGRLLATAGQDHILRVWVLRDAFDYFNNKRQKYNTESKVSPSPSQESLASHQSAEDADKATLGDADADGGNVVFNSKPFCTYTGHTADLLDVSWSKNYFILSSSMDKTVRLWHISRKECLCCFQHIDFVTAIAFHPRDDRYFISGSLDGKLRLWNIPDKKVALWNELDGQTKLITAANFCQNGKFAVVGSYDGRCIFYNTEHLKYFTQIHVRSTRGKNAKGRKISGIEPMPGEDKILVTSNDSRIRLYDLRDLSLSCKYKGYVNLSSQIRASFSHDGKYIISGSENQYFYAWKTHYDYSKFSSARRDRNDYWEGIKAHNALVTAAVFAPKPFLIFKQLDSEKNNLEGLSSSRTEGNVGYIIVTADFNGGIKIFANKSKSKSSTS